MKLLIKFTWVYPIRLIFASLALLVLPVLLLAFAIDYALTGGESEYGWPES